MAKAYTKSQNYLFAIPTFEKILKIADQNMIISDDLYYKIAKSYCENNKFINAICYFNKYLHFSENYTNSKEKLICRGYDILINSEKIAELFVKGNYLQIINENINETLNILETYFIGESYRFLGNIENATNYFEKVLEKGLDYEIIQKKFLMKFVNLSKMRIDSLLSKKFPLKNQGISDQSSEPSYNLDSQIMNENSYIESINNDRFQNIKQHTLKNQGITVSSRVVTELDRPAPVSIHFIQPQKNNQNQQQIKDKLALDECDRDSVLTIKNTIVIKQMRTDSFYEALCEANKLELALEQQYSNTKYDKQE